MGEALALAREANVYLDRKAPWFQIKEDPAAAATSVYVTRSVRVVDNLKTILASRFACRTPRNCSPAARVPGLRRAAPMHRIGHPAGGPVPGGDAEPRGADVRSQPGRRHVGEECTAAGPGAARAGAAAPMARKLDESVIEEEYARLGG